MGIKNGDLPDADEVMNAFGKVFKNQAQLIFNADLIGLDSLLDEEYELLKRDIFDSNSDIDMTNSELTNVPIVSAESLDEMSDSSIDANIWTVTAGVTESTEGMNFHAASTSVSGTKDYYAIGDQVNTKDFNGTNSIILKQTYTISGSVSGSAYVKITLVDESANEVDLYAHTVSSSQFSNGTETLRININASTNSAAASATDINYTTDTGIDLSSLTDGDAWHIKIRNYATSNVGATSAAFLTVRGVRYLENAVASIDFISDETTATETITNAILVGNKSIGTSSSAVFYMSADNGANYEAVTLNEIHRFTNTGTQLKVKTTLTSTATQVYVLNHYAVMYNLY